MSNSATPWTSERQASWSITNSRNLLKLKSIHPTISSSVVPFSHLQSFPASGSFPVVSSSHQVAKVLEFQLQHQSFQWIFRTISFRIDRLDLLAVQGTGCDTRLFFQLFSALPAFLQNTTRWGLVYILIPLYPWLKRLWQQRQQIILAKLNSKLCV